MSLSWDPVRVGKTYCSPGCGGGCTWAAYREAELRSKDLARTMGKGWSGRVWENLGWHWEACSPNSVIHIRSNDCDYTATIDHGRWIAHGDTPRRAVENAIVMLRTDVLARSSVLEAAMGDCNEN